jgi:hypothetical protein
MMSVWAALFASGDAPRGAIRDASGWSWFGLSPLRIALVGAAAICWTQWRLRRRVSALLAASAASLFAVLGHTPDTMGQHVRWLWRFARHAACFAFPESRAGWGALLFCAAFLLLGLGTALSWRYGRRPGSSVADP